MSTPQSEAPKPNFFIVGALKCGTTAWYEYLRTHPDIFMPDMKEPSFFTSDLPQWRIHQSEAEYLKLFADSGGARVIGDASPMSLVSTAAARAIQRFNPAARILILLRSQDDYLPSLHNQLLLQFDEGLGDFAEAWRLSGNRPPETIPQTCDEPRLLDYAAMGRFHEQVSRYLDAFPAEQVRILWFEDWVSDPRPAYAAVLRFLGVEDDGRRDFPPANVGVTYRSRRAARWLFYPPAPARRFARLLKRLTGLRADTQMRLVDWLVGLASAPGYRRQLTPQLREEIRGYFAEDNRMLNARLVPDGPLRKPAHSPCNPHRTGW